MKKVKYGENINFDTTALNLDRSITNGVLKDGSGSHVVPEHNKPTLYFCTVFRLSKLSNKKLQSSVLHRGSFDNRKPDRTHA